MSMNTAAMTARDNEEQFVRFDRFGYVRIRDLFRSGAVVYVLLTGLVTVLTSDPITLAFLGLLVVIIFLFSPVERYFPAERRVTVYDEGGLYIAEHVGSGTFRHGGTQADALASLEEVICR